MSQITNDAEFKQALQGLDYAQQRVVAVMFIEHVLPLSSDERLNRVVKMASDPNASEDELSSALDSAKAATLDSHARCGAEGHWSEQAGYFVARAVVAAITPEAQSRASGPAWQAAISSRMAHISVLIDDESNELSIHTETEWQYQILSDYLERKKS
ncbi:hypothetical protein THIOM_004756 [Candidatus Thiomargarita nelsonii]|uniref:Uncharacterized protein n=1 Tax=Candidatus Thiomargarita nelsonii TaxID=1003181 RepID=A0A0A6P0S6_9GAMM|nr:hypothetical protein THIOM_004756 [Candidatus Thiomargarita nelsonii]